jgi:hypothetical protein
MPGNNSATKTRNNRRIVGFEVFTAVTMKNAAFWGVAPCRCGRLNRCFGGSSLVDFSTLKMEAIRSSETSVQSTTSTRRHTPEGGILHSHRRENLKSYNFYLFVCNSLYQLLTLFDVE